MNTRRTTVRASGSWGKRGTEQRESDLQVGSRIRVTSYGPFRGLKGTIKTVDTISDDFDEPFCFYLVALDGAYSKEPIWFQYHEVEGIDPLDASLHKSGWLTSTSE
jgi:hypothetical protein